MQERRNSIANVFLALTHGYVDMPITFNTKTEM